MEFHSIDIETDKTPIKDKVSSSEIISIKDKVSRTEIISNLKRIYKPTISLLIFGILITILLVYIRVDEELKYAHEIISDVHELIHEGNTTLGILEVLKPETEILLDDVDKLQTNSEMTQKTVGKSYIVTKLLCKSDNCINKDDYNDDYVNLVYGKTR